MREPSGSGTSSHTKDAQLQKGSRTFNMSKSYDRSVSGHLAEYMIYLFTASSFWFSSDSSYDSARRSAILFFKFPGFGWGGAFSSWILIFLCFHAGHLLKIAGRRLSRIISSVSFHPTEKDLVSIVPAA